FDVDVISGFGATNYPSTNGLSFEEVREALLVFAQQKNLAALEITAYNPTKNSDGDAAKKIVDLLTEVLRVRLEILREAEALVAASAPPPPAPKASAIVQDSPAPESAEPIEPIDGVGL